MHHLITPFKLLSRAINTQDDNEVSFAGSSDCLVRKCLFLTLKTTVQELTVLNSPNYCAVPLLMNV